MAFFTAEQIAGISDFYDELIESFSVPCKLIYIRKFEAGEPTLKFADDTYAQNIGLHGGPIQSDMGQSGGSDLIAEESTETIDLVVDWTIKDGRIFGKIITQPYDILRTHGALTDLPKIQRAVTMEVNLPGQPITKGVYKILSQGSDIFSIVKGRHFNCYWERVA